MSSHNYKPQYGLTLLDKHFGKKNNNSTSIFCWFFSFFVGQGFYFKMPTRSSFIQKRNTHNRRKATKRLKKNQFHDVTVSGEEKQRAVKSWDSLHKSIDTLPCPLSTLSWILVLFFFSFSADFNLRACLSRVKLSTKNKMT